MAIEFEDIQKASNTVNQRFQRYKECYIGEPSFDQAFKSVLVNTFHQIHQASPDVLIKYTEGFLTAINGLEKLTNSELRLPNNKLLEKTNIEIQGQIQFQGASEALVFFLSWRQNKKTQGGFSCQPKDILATMKNAALGITIA